MGGSFKNRKKARDIASDAPDPKRDLLEMGAILPLVEDVSGYKSVDTAFARTFVHPALPSQTFVDVSPKSLASARELELAAIGLTPQGKGVGVGHMRRQALGFPGWALVNDKKRSHYALAVVKQFRQVTRRASAKPGHARDGVMKIAAELKQSVPHFLPSFFEEAARTFLQAGARQYASQFFGKAREAEKVYALDVDEDARAEAFLEFALAGAVSNKVLSEYARVLVESRSPEDAYEYFRTLCLQRTLGGMPPWGAMFRDLNKLARNAGLDTGHEALTFIETVFDTPSLEKAPRDFWNHYAPAIKAVSADNPARLRHLLMLFPNPGGSKQQEFEAWWLEFLDECGALALLNSDASTAAQRKRWWEAAYTVWLSGWRKDTLPPRAFSFLEESAPRLVADDTELKLCNKWGRDREPDFYDLALSLGINVDESRGPLVDLNTWAGQVDAPGHGRDLSHLWAHPAFRDRLVLAVRESLGEEPFETESRQRPALLEAKREALLQLLADDARGLPDCGESIEQLSSATTALSFADCPGTYEKLQRKQVAPALARTLRGGIYDELGWTAFADACDGLVEDERQCSGLFPYLVVFDKKRAKVAGPEGVVLEHDFAKAAQGKVSTVYYVGGQLLVCYRLSWDDQRAYWSGDGEEFPYQAGYGTRVLAQVRHLDDGRVVTAGGIVAPGDRNPKFEGTLVCDGENYWHYQSYPTKLIELDPQSGKLGRESRPAFWDVPVPRGMEFEFAASMLMPVPAGVTPLCGQKNGLMGFRVLERDHEFEEDESTKKNPWLIYESITGERFESPESLGGGMFALVTFPGASEPTVVRNSYYHWAYDDDMLLCSADGQQRNVKPEASYRRGTVMPLPAAFWPMLTFRDEAGSRALRGCDASMAEQLLAEWDTFEVEDKAARVQSIFPTLRSEALRAGVIGIVDEAKQQQQSLAALVKSRAPDNAATAAIIVGDEHLGALLGGRRWGKANGTLSQQVAAVSHFFAADDPASYTSDISESDVEWSLLFSNPRALAFLAVQADEAAADAAKLLELYAVTCFSEPQRKLRRVKFVGDIPDGFEAGLYHENGNDYFLKQVGWWRNSSLEGIEHARSGGFCTFREMTVESEQAFVALERDYIEALLAKRRAEGPCEYSPAIAAAVSARTGLTPTEAAVAWTGFRNVISYSSDFMDKSLRLALELKTTQLRAAKGYLSGLAPRKMSALLSAACPDDLHALWNPMGAGADDDSSVVARFSSAWIELFGERVPLPEALLMEAEKRLEAPQNFAATQALSALADPEDVAEFNVDNHWREDEVGDPEPALDGGCFNDDIAKLVVSAVAFMVHNLPSDAPQLAKLPEALAKVDARLANSIPWNIGYLEDGQKARLRMFPGEEYGEGDRKQYDAGLVLTMGRYGYACMRPQRVKTAEDWDSLSKMLKAIGAYNSDAVVALHLLQSESWRSLCQPLALPRAGMPADPRIAVPDIVGSVMTQYGVSEAAATLYLQTLVLYSPTKKDIERINNWKPAAYKKAAAELVSASLLIEAKRSRAGRAYFLPGAWIDLKTPRLPMEAWKARLYGLRFAGGSLTYEVAGFSCSIPHYFPLKPLPDAFRDAWERLSAGDVPEFSEVAA